MQPRIERLNDSFKLVMFVAVVMLAVLAAEMFLTHIVPAEILHSSVVMIPIWVLAAAREVAMISVVRIEVTIYVTAKIAIVSVIPGTSPNERPVGEPFRAIVAVRRALIWRVIIVAVRTCRFGSDLHAKADLRVRLWYQADQAECGYSSQKMIGESLHGSPLRSVHCQSFRLYDA